MPTELLPTQRLGSRDSLGHDRSTSSRTESSRETHGREKPAGV